MAFFSRNPDLPFAPAITDVVSPAREASCLEDEVVALFDQLRGRMLRYVLGFGLPMADAEEIVQEVFLALFQHLSGGKPRISMRAWVFQVAHNLSLKRRQAMARSSGTVSGEEGAVEMADPAPDPEVQLASLQRRERLQSVLRALPEADRRCLTLRAEGLRYREIAEVLGISLGGVANSLAKSLARISAADSR